MNYKKSESKPHSNLGLLSLQNRTLKSPFYNHIPSLYQVLNFRKQFLKMVYMRVLLFLQSEKKKAFLVKNPPHFDRNRERHISSSWTRNGCYRTALVTSHFLNDITKR